MRRARLALLLTAVLAVAACGGSGALTPTTVPSVLPTRIEVTLTDQMTMVPNPIPVPRSRLVTFVVTNAGALDHEFLVGDEATQQEHSQEMIGHQQSGGEMLHDHFNGVGLTPGQTKELKLIFDSPVPTIAGCHVPGHYEAGMKATISVG